ncbi:GGDEF domain-containing protein [Marinicella litoralis]|uniref:diguanylate cyclase n=1 Tax=Marinicella litoralis TaxID=644220 RepID=A0A4R6XLK6_9GAMM|nr:GGDEF domain-containing protein [Marinicella litoralis]TDR18477.1 diguanylate cyclase (GGDEF)-like protein [Marinicella litoralis]
MADREQARKEKEIIVMGLSLSYAIGVGLFAAIRYFNHEYVVATLDVVLAAFGLYVFVYVLKTRSTKFPGLAIAIISVIGTIATIALKGAEQVYWAYPSVALVFYLLPTRQALLIWGVTATIILIQLIDLPSIKLISIAMTILITSFFCHLFSSTMNDQHNRLRHIANQDVLTQVKNRRAFNHDAAMLERSPDFVTAILFDLDNFKQVNDTYGHATGDQVLKDVTLLVNQFVTGNEHLYRIGGDEFAILCQGKDFDHAYQLANTIHQEFSQSTINQEHNITLSLAVAQKEMDESINEWLNRLDSALYKAKKSGRNQIVKAIRY